MAVTTIRSSSSDRLLLCHGSITLEEIVAKRDSLEGADGTLIHDRIAFYLTRQFCALYPGGHIFSAKALPLNTEWIASFCVREVAEKVPDDWSLEVETGLSYLFDNFGSEFILSGHIDAMAISPDGSEAIAFDWKTVYNAVDVAECNEQALSYCALMKRAYPSLRKITFYIVQPRVDEEMGFQRVSSVTMQMDEALMGRFEKRILAALAQPMSLSTGPKQCRFCAAKLQCFALRGDAETMKMIMTEEQLASIKATPDDATLADWVLTAKTLEAAMDEAKEIAKERIAAKGFITARDGTNISVKETAGSYEIIDRDQFQKSLLSIIPAERLAHCTKPSMTEVKREIAAALDVPLSGKAAINATTVFDGKLRPFVEQGKRHILIFS